MTTSMTSAESSHAARMKKVAEDLCRSQKSATLTKEKYDAIIDHLKDISAKVDPHFRHWVKKRNFKLMDLPGLGLKEVLVVPAKDTDNFKSSRFLRVVSTADIYEITRHVHVDELKHGGYKKVMDHVQNHYYGITRGYLQEFCRHCPTCQLSQLQKTRLPPPLIPIVEDNFLDRIQVDLIDMRHCPDNEYHHIAHFVDHFTKFHVLFPLKTKSAIEVAQLLEERVLAYFGPPKIFHSDNGWEFVDQLVHALLMKWGGDMTFVNGESQHSQSQGLVEWGNRTVKKKLAAMKAEHTPGDNETHYPWASWLPQIMYSMNIEVHATTKDSPYYLVYGRDPPSAVFPGEAQTKVVDEEDLELCFTDKHMSHASHLLSEEFPGVHGLQDTILQQNQSRNVPPGEYVQFLHVDGNHWVVISTVGCTDSATVYLYDSLKKKPSIQTADTIARFHRTSDKMLTIKVMNIDRQKKGKDCGVYAIAFATSILHGQDPTQLQFIDPRRHLIQCFKEGRMSPFPAKVSQRSASVFITVYEQIYCHCRGIENGELMVACEKCDLWFHCSCCSIKDKVPDDWRCTECRIE